MAPKSGWDIFVTYWIPIIQVLIVLV